MPDITPDTTPDTIHRIPLAEIDAEALSRDRTALDEAALDELRLSIAANGLRMPVELWTLSEPRKTESGGVCRYGLISGLRRLRAFQGLLELTGDERYAAIPAFVRTPASYADALTAMVEENEVRAELSPWERGRIAWRAWREEVFPTVEEAVAKLFPSATYTKRSRLYAVARLVEELDGWLTNPESLSLRQCLRLQAAYQAGFGEVIRTALDESEVRDAGAEWQLLAPILAEAERLPAEPAPQRPGRPRRVYRPRESLTIRREMTRDGWSLHFTGRQATSVLLDVVFDEIERMFSPG